MTIRCPKCQKKQADPSPMRCGCGQSLLAVLASAGDVAGARTAEPETPARAVVTPRPRVAEGWVGGTERRRVARDHADNEW